jgi:DNA-binding response OmpR family regulator
MAHHIAIVDDEKDIIDMLETYLSRKLPNIKITHYVDASHALIDIKSGQYDLVLLDIMMPKINGMDILTQVKESTPSTKIIMMTAFSTQDKVIQCLKDGADDYVTKPFLSLRDVQSKIADQLKL